MCQLAEQDLTRVPEPFAGHSDASSPPFGCHISEVKRQEGGAWGYSVGKSSRALKKPPSLHGSCMVSQGGCQYALKLLSSEELLLVLLL